MAELVVSDLRAAVEGNEILRGLDLTVRSGEVHAVMGPNGSGKSTLSHVLMGRPGYDVTGGSITLDGVELVGRPTWERAAAGLFLAMQYPVEVPGVRVGDVLAGAIAARGGDAATVPDAIRREADRIAFPDELLDRALNVDLSGGEQKRNETLQLGVLAPRIAILDELDSGLDVDGLGAVAARIREATTEDDLGVLVITHYARLLEVLQPDRVHVLARGTIVEEGGPELARRLEEVGYEQWTADDDADTEIADGNGDPFADPFADPLA